MLFLKIVMVVIVPCEDKKCANFQAKKHHIIVNYPIKQKNSHATSTKKFALAATTGPLPPIIKTFLMKMAKSNMVRKLKKGFFN